jgi:hypothetical protein
MGIAAHDAFSNSTIVVTANALHYANTLIVTEGDQSRPFLFCNHLKELWDWLDDPTENTDLSL